MIYSDRSNWILHSIFLNNYLFNIFNITFFQSNSYNYCVFVMEFSIYLTKDLEISLIIVLYIPIQKYSFINIYYYL